MDTSFFLPNYLIDNNFLFYMKISGFAIGLPIFDENLRKLYKNFPGGDPYAFFPNFMLQI